ncbi:MAG: carboxypeptidase-like regulatory domain-containing protein [Flavobacteriaceae bacterium]|nr:carboxypeptidase-like regulatory domain-containing protein [Flavobacteriaceae bacterium]
MRKITQFLLVAVVMFTSTAAMSQSTVTGTVMDSDLNAPLPGANVIEKGTQNGTTTDFDGKFTLKTQSSSGEIVISFVGYATVTVAFNGNTNLSNVALSADNSLDEIVIVGTGVIDLAEDRKTPVAVSTIKASEIQNKIGAQDVTMTLVNTPSVYVAGQTGGFGDSRINVRGFDQTNTAYLLNGQPINGMEDGRMYWSNWSGINDIAAAVQIQRGLGASKLAISSVGGTVNFVMRTTNKTEGGYMYAGIANDDYLKTTVMYNTGKNEKGWGASFMLSHWQGDGYMDGTFGEGQTYFFSLGYTPNDKHNFNFLLTGAPQRHDQAFSEEIGTYLERGRRFNSNWGTYGGEYMTSRRNFYHKPIANLNWDFKINEKTEISTVLYASWGRGGGTGPRGDQGDATPDGQIDYDAIYAFNNSVENGAGGYYTAGGGYITRSSMNMHNWYGVVSNLENTITENLTFNIGFDVRTYFGEHFRIVEDFHGLSSWREEIGLIDQNNNHQIYGSYGDYKFVETSESMSANPWSALFANIDREDRIAYDTAERISYGGVFGQLEYSKDEFSAFFQGAVNNQWYQRFDYYQYADADLINGTSSQGTTTPLPDEITAGTDSEKVSEFGYNLKLGGSYKFTEAHHVYANTGLYSRQPFFDNIFPEYTNQRFPLAENETIFGLEAGYAFKSEFFSANLNLYRTQWKDRVEGSSFVEDGVLKYRTNFGVEQLHQGVELDFTAKPMDVLKVKGFVSVGDWKYKGTVVTQIRDDEQNIESTEEEDIDGGEVGDAAQFTLGLGADYNIVKNLSIDADFRYYDKLYANVGAVSSNLELPSYNLVDAGVSYKLELGKDKDKSLNFRVNINNIFDNVYLSELRSNIQEGDEDASGVTYKGIDTANQGFFGFGRTWNVSLRYKF